MKAEEKMTAFMVLMCVISIAADSDLEFNIRAMNYKLHKQWRVATQSVKRARQIRINEDVLRIEKWSNCRSVKLYNDAGFYLSVRSDEVIGISEELLEDQALFQIETYGRGVVMLKHVLSNAYICMTTRGEVKVRPRPQSSCLFIQHQIKIAYDTFASVKYYLEERYDMFISMRKNGKLRKGSHTSAEQETSHFRVWSANSRRNMVCK